MTRTIYKYPLPLHFTGLFRLAMPRVINILTIQLQQVEATNEFRPCIWAIVDKGDVAPGTFHMKKFHVVGTGWDLDNMGGCTKYIGTWQDGSYVWHLFGEQ